MRTVVADSGPLRYLVLIGEIDILPKVVGEVLIPPEVRYELDRPETPASVRAWIAARPSWLAVQPGPAVTDPALARLDPGERAAIALAASIGADAVLMDDRAGVAVALAKGLAVLGTLGVLDRAAQRGLIDLEGAFTRLRATNFRYPAALLDTLLDKHRRRADREQPDGA
ncbi:MAG: DUF3368 domain-containing protein [Devosia sp.]